MPPTLQPAPNWGLRAAHAAAGAVVMAAVVAQIARPLAPDLGPPPDAGAFFDPAHLARAEAYRAPLRLAGLAALVVRIAVPLLFVLSPPGRWAVDALGRIGRHRPVVGAASVGVGMVVAIDVVLLPLAFWSGYVHEGVWGFRTQGLAGWARDWVVTRSPTWLGIGAVAALGIMLVRRLPRFWPPVAGLAGVAVTALVVFLAPLVLEPMWFRLAPLESGPVRSEVERVLELGGAEVDAILVADASRRTTKENAYVSGLGSTRRVVLYDTLLASRSPDVVGVVLAHELGHDRHGDLWRGTLLGGAGAVAGSYAVAALLRRNQEVEVGRSPGPRGVAAAVALLLVLNLASLPLQTWLSRRAEAAADLASLQFTDDPEGYEALHRGFTLANLSDPAPPPWAYLLWWTHPTTPERLRMGEAYAAHGSSLGQETRP